MILVNKSYDYLNLNKLLDECKDALFKVESLIKIDHTIRFQLSENLTSDENNQLDNILQNFEDSDPEDETPIIIDLATRSASGKHFHDILYNVELTQKLQKKSTIIQGEMRKVEWFKRVEIVEVNGLPVRNYFDKVLEVDNEWERDDAGFPIYKHPPIRTYYMRNGQPHHEKKILDEYYYEDYEQIQEGLKRRSLLVASIQKPVMHLMASVLMPLGYSIDAVLLKGRTFLDEYDLEFSKFINNSSSVNDPGSPDFLKKTVVARLEKEGLVIDEVLHGNPDNAEWLDKYPPALGGLTSIRDYLVNEFSI